MLRLGAGRLPGLGITHLLLSNHLVPDSVAGLLQVLDQLLDPRRVAVVLSPLQILDDVLDLSTIGGLRITSARSSPT